MTEPAVKTTEDVRMAGFLPNLGVNRLLLHLLVLLLRSSCLYLSVTKPPTKEKIKANPTVMLVMRESQRVASSDSSRSKRRSRSRSRSRCSVRISRSSINCRAEIRNWKT